MRRTAHLAFAITAAVALGGPPASADTRPDTSYAGWFLVASPDMGDPRFSRAVIYLVDHHADGAMGLIVNKPVEERPLAEVLEGLDIDAPENDRTIRIHYGGPVEPDAGFVLHSPEYDAEDTIQVPPYGHAALSTSVDVLQDMAEGTGPERTIVVFGYAGWGPGQLEDELEQGAWATVPPDTQLLFDPEADGKWERAWERRGREL